MHKDKPLHCIIFRGASVEIIRINSSVTFADHHPKAGRTGVVTSAAVSALATPYYQVMLPDGSMEVASGHEVTLHQ